MGRKITEEEFKERARQIHGDFYDYSEVEYKNKEEKVSIICPEHGEFWQHAGSHLRGSGCPSCSRLKRTESNKKTTQEFIVDAVSVHGDWYDYSKVNYKNFSTKVTIVCPIHGEFKQTPLQHLQGKGCQKCAIDKNAKKNTLSLSNFINKAYEVHGDWYDYSKVNYKNFSTKVTIVCPEHGPFEQFPNNHLRGSGCPKCGINKKRSSREEFISKSQKIHGDWYDYSKVIYQDSHTYVTIICPEHGEFQQKPYSHLNGQGCLVCGGKKQLTTEEFIERAQEAHGSFYDYSKVDYQDAFTPVVIICPEHGEFQQKPNDHLSGHGCLKCKKENYNFWGLGYIKKHHADKLNDPCTFYIIECYSDNEQFIKIGITSRTIEKRYQNNLNDYYYKTLYEYHSTLLECSELEQNLLKQFKDYQYNPEYKFAGSSECLTYDVLDDIFQEINYNQQYEGEIVL